MLLFWRYIHQIEFNWIDNDTMPYKSNHMDFCPKQKRGKKTRCCMLFPQRSKVMEDFHEPFCAAHSKTPLLLFRRPAVSTRTLVMCKVWCLTVLYFLLCPLSFEMWAPVFFWGGKSFSSCCGLCLPLSFRTYHNHIKEAGPWTAGRALPGGMGNVVWMIVRVINARKLKSFVG